MTNLRRIISGTAANGLNLVYLVVVGLATTPGLVWAWGASGYGTWLLLTSIPTYLALSDFGFSTAAMNTMAMQHAKGKNDDVVEIFHSLILLHLWAFSGIITITGAIVLIFIFVFNSDLIIHFWNVIILLSIFTCFSMFSRVILAGFRAAGLYTSGTILYDAGQFIGNVAIIPIALLGGSYMGCAIVWILVRIASIAVLYIRLRKSAPWLSVGVRHARVSILRSLWHPAVGSMVIPSALALNQQGVAAVVGVVISPAATATLSAVRTASRLAVQAVSVVNRATVPELSAASARGEIAAIERILWINILSIVALLVPIALMFGIWGSPLVSLWTGGKIIASPDFIFLITVSMVIHACWFFGTNLLMATNAHLEMAKTLAISSALAALLAWPAALFWGLDGVALVIVCSEAVCLIRFLSVAPNSRMSLSRASLKALLRR